MFAFFLKLLIGVAIQIVGYLLIGGAKKSKPEIATDFDAPTSDAGRPVPVVFGEVLIEGPNVLNTFDKNTEMISHNRQKLPRYRLGMHLGICVAGPNIELLSVEFEGKSSKIPSVMWQDVRETWVPDMFGGVEKEGGIEGWIWWMPGYDTQVIPEYLAQKMNRTSWTCPAYRGIASVFLTERQGWPVKGFVFGMNTPYLKRPRFRVFRPPMGLNPAYTTMVFAKNLSMGLFGQFFRSVNPVHIYYECMTNRVWGKGESPANFIMEEWEAAAKTIYDERFGMNIIWSREAPIDDFLKEIRDHIQGGHYRDMETGRYGFKLLRADYDVSAVPEINPSNAVIKSFVRQAWGKIANEIVVSFTDPVTWKQETVTAQDTAALESQNDELISDTRNYYAVQSRELAQRLAERDLAASCYPIATCEVEVNAELWGQTRNDVVKLVWPDKGINGVYFRISEVRPVGRKIGLKLIEDVFLLPRASYLETGPDAEPTPGVDPTPLENYNLGTMPAFFTVAALGLPSIAALPETVALSDIIVAHDTPDDIGFELLIEGKNALGQSVDFSMGDRGLRTSWTVTNFIPNEAETWLPIPESLMGQEPRVGDFLYLGAGNDQAVEIGIIDAVSGGSLRLARGVLDTTPKYWAPGTRVWCVPNPTIYPDTLEHTAFDTVQYRFLTSTSRGKLAAIDAPQVSLTLTNRPHLPLRPANVKVNGQGFETVEALSGDLTVTWATRNRVAEVNQIVKWTDGSVAPEAGQTTRVQVLDEDRNLIVQYAGLAGTMFVVPRSALSGYSRVIIRVTAQRDGASSLQGHEVNTRLM